MRNSLLVFFLLSLLFVTGLQCGESIQAPKPRGYFRIDFPEHAYSNFQPTDCPFSFDVPTYATVVNDTDKLKEKCWMNIEFGGYKGTVYLSYRTVNNDLAQLTDDCRNMAMKHTAKASAIDEPQFIDRENHVYGLNYSLKGNAASPVQFWLTDSTNHFLRGSLYFYAVPNADSIAPVLDFVKEDIRRLIESVRWK